MLMSTNIMVRAGGKSDPLFFADFVERSSSLAGGGLSIASPALPRAAPAPAPAKRTPPNLVLITMDTTRADHLGAWG